MDDLLLKEIRDTLMYYSQKERYEVKERFFDRVHSKDSIIPVYIECTDIDNGEKARDLLKKLELL